MFCPKAANAAKACSHRRKPVDKSNQIRAAIAAAEEVRAMSTFTKLFLCNKMLKSSQGLRMVGFKDI